jgi:hypothetical protein
MSRDCAISAASSNSVATVFHLLLSLTTRSFAVHALHHLWRCSVGASEGHMRPDSAVCACTRDSLASSLPPSHSPLDARCSVALRKTPLFSQLFFMLSPEPVLVKSSFLNMNGAKSGVFRTSSRNLSSRCRLDINAKQRSCPSAFPMLVPSLAW